MLVSDDDHKLIIGQIEQRGAFEHTETFNMSYEDDNQDSDDTSEYNDDEDTTYHEMDED